MQSQVYYAILTILRQRWLRTSRRSRRGVPGAGGGSKTCHPEFVDTKGQGRGCSSWTNAPAPGDGAAEGDLSACSLRLLLALVAPVGTTSLTSCPPADRRRTWPGPGFPARKSVVQGKRG